MRYAASHSVLQGHRYRVVIDSLSKSKFPMFLAGNRKPVEFEAESASRLKGTLLGDMHYAGVPRRKFMMPEKSAAACPWALNSA